MPQAIASSELTPLTICDGNWKSAEDDPDTVIQLVDDDIEKGRIGVLEGGLSEAERRWDLRAKGKFGVVRAEGRDPRLVGDSIVCGMSSNVQICENRAAFS